MSSERSQGSRANHLVRASLLTQKGVAMNEESASRHERQDDVEDDVLTFRLYRDLKKAAATMTPSEARQLVDMYYMMQEYRKGLGNQEKALDKSKEPHATVTWFSERFHQLETQVKGALDVYSQSQPLGQWARAQVGIGPVITAGLLAHIDLTKAPTCGHVWRFAGLDPTAKWNKGEKRPWNASLKTLCWKIGESFVKVSGKPEAFYGKLYLQRKAIEIVNNEAGKFREQAAAKLRDFNIGKDTDARAWYEGRFMPPIFEELSAQPSDKRIAWLKARQVEVGKGVPMLPPAHIHARACRWAVKMFLSHYWQRGRELAGLPIVRPFPIVHLEGHTHVVEVP